MRNVGQHWYLDLKVHRFEPNAYPEPKPLYGVCGCFDTHAQPKDIKGPFCHRCKDEKIRFSSCKCDRCLLLINPYAN